MTPEHAPGPSAVERVLPEAVGRINASVVTRDLGDGETALFRPDPATFLTLNTAGTWLWDRCVGGRTIDELIREAVDHFEWDPADADPAVRHVIHTLVRKGFVRRGATDRLLARNQRPYSVSTTRWAWQQRYEMLDVGLVLRSNDREIGRELETLFEVFSVDSPVRVTDIVWSAVAFDGDDGPSHDLVRYEPAEEEARLVVSAGTAEAVVMESLVSVNSVAISRSPLYSIHAAAVAVDTDVTLIPAVSDVGKSTLVAGCLRQGFRYVTDESLSIRLATGSVVVYPKPLWLQRWSREALGILDVTPMWEPDTFKDAIIDPAALGPVADVVQHDLRPRRVVALERRDGPAELTRLSVGDTATVLATNTFDKRVRPRKVFDTSIELARELDGWRLSFSDPKEASELLWRRFGRPA